MKKFLLLIDKKQNVDECIFYTTSELKYISSSHSTSIRLFISGNINYKYLENNDGFEFDYGEVIDDGSNKKTIGNSIKYIISKESISVKNDILGSMPIYYFTSKDLCVVTNNLADIRKIVSITPDSVGIFQFLSKAYTVGSRTLYENVYQLRPSSVLEIKYNSSEIYNTINSLDSPWVNKEIINIEECVAELSNRWKHLSKRLDGYQLMMSAGWDSRTMLSGVLSAGCNVFGYSHGDVRSRELAIAKKICKDVGVEHNTFTLSEDTINLNLLENMLMDCDTCMFPHWRVAAQNAANNGLIGLAGGIFGGIMGGHYGIISILNKKDQYKAMFSYLAKINSSFRSHDKKNSIEAAKRYLLNVPKKGSWALSEEFNSLITASLADKYREDVSNILDEYIDAGTSDLHNIIERFQVEHKGRQYMNCQINVSLPLVRVINPFADEEILRMAVALPIESKLHNKINIKLIKELYPSLLKYPMAATLVPAAYPMVIQEISRGIRKAYEGCNLVINKNKELHLGWNNFSFLIKGKLIPDIIESLNASIWNKNQMTKVFKKAKPGNIYPLLDMFLKIKTIDHKVGEFL